MIAALALAALLAVDDAAWLAELREAFRGGGTWRAQRELGEYLEEFPDSSAGRRLAAEVAFGRGELEQAEEHLRAGGLEGAVLHGRLLLRLGRHEEALALARSGAWPDGDAPEDASPLAAAVLETDALARLGRLADARRTARETTDATDDRTLDGYGLLDLGRLYVAQRRFELAGQAFVFADADLNGRQGPAYELREPAALVELGRVYATTRQSGGAADPTLSVLNEVLDLDDGDPDALCAKARAYLYAQKGGEADAALSAALQRDPRHPEALALTGKLALVDRRIDAGLERAERLLADDPRHPDGLALRAAALAAAGNDGAGDARARFAAAHPESNALDALLGEVLQRHYRFAESVPPLERALATDPLDESPLPVLAQSLAHLGRETEARAALAEHAERSPFPFPWRANMIRVLDKLQDSVEIVQEGRWRLRLPPGEQDVLGPLLLERLEEARAEMAARWGVDPDGEVLVEVFDEHADFSVRTVGFSGFGAVGACFGRVFTMLSPLCELRGRYTWAQTAVHEYAHVVALELSRQRVPRWLTEGISVVEEKRGHPSWARELDRDVLNARANGHLLPVARLNQAFRDARTIMLGYYQGSLLCEVVERDFGFEGLRDLVAAYGDGLGTEAAIRRTLGIEPEELDERLADYVEDVVAARARVRPRYDEAGKERLRRRAMGGDDSALLPLATAYHDLGRAADRDAALSRHLDLFGETPGALRLLAERDAAEGRYEEAREKLVAWTERTERQDADAWVLLAELHDRAGEPDAALAALRRARELFPGDVSPRGALPRLLARLPAPEESEEARALLAELCRIDEEAVEPRLVLARLHADEDDDERAIAYYREAVEIDPYLPEARAALAALLAGAGRDDLASAQWQLVLGMRADQVNVSGERFAELREEAARAVRDGP